MERVYRLRYLSLVVALVCVVRAVGCKAVTRVCVGITKQPFRPCTYICTHTHLIGLQAPLLFDWPISRRRHYMCRERAGLETDTPQQRRQGSAREPAAASGCCAGEKKLPFDHRNWASFFCPSSPLLFLLAPAPGSCAVPPPKNADLQPT